MQDQDRSHRGWILDLYPKPGQMIVWLKKEDGSCVRLVDRWKPRIHVAGEIGDLLNLACKPFAAGSRFVEKFERAGDSLRSTVLELEVKSEREAVSLARRIQRYGNYSKFRLYDVDVPSTQTYLYAKNLFPLALVEAEQAAKGTVHWNLRDSREASDYPLPPLRKIRLHVNTRKTRRIQGFDDELDSISIQDGDDGGAILGIDSGDEVEKLHRLVEAFHEIDPDIILTDGGDSFIFPYLARRAAHHGVLDGLILGREQSPLRVYELQGHSYFSYGKIAYRQTAARLLGRLHVDEANTLISSDCGLEGLFEVARTCIIPLQRASRSTIGTSMTSLQLYHAVKQDILIPWNKNDPEDWKSGNELILADRGGFIYEPTCGIHDSVGELDFSSLYPTIMQKMNLSGETVRCRCCPDSANKVPELGWNICERWRGIVPQSLDLLLRKRAQYKRLKKEASDPPTRLRFDQRQAALKWILVCSFGYLGFKNARFGRIDAHIATCAFARDVLRKAVGIAESRGFTLVHGIVDSMWLKKPAATVEEYEQLCAEIQKELDFPISFEGRYKWIVFLNSRVDPRVPVLNRYYGVLEDGTMKVRGIDLRRHDTPGIVRKCQTEMLIVLSEANSSREFRFLIPKTLKVPEGYVSLLRAGRVPIEDLVVEKSLSKMPNEYTNQVPQAIVAKQLIQEGREIHAGQHVSYIMIRIKSRIPENRALPVELIDENTSYDSERYVELLLSSVRNLLPPGYGLKSLTAFAGS